MFLMSALVTARLVASAGDGSAIDDDADPYRLEAPRWIVHRVTPGEKLVHAAVRFGVTPTEVADWNDLPRGRQRLRVGQRLKIEARRMPPERTREVYVVEPGQSWTDVAVALRVDRRMLQAFNWRHKRLSEGDELVYWTDPGLPRTVNVHPGPPPPPTIEVRADGRSVGRPQIGRIENAVQLPEREWYTRGDPDRMWGSSHTITTVLEAFSDFRYRTGFEGEVVVGAISLRKGRRFPPHQSHQSGRDIDIRLPLLPGLGTRLDPHPDWIDWSATWELVDAFLDTGHVQFIFLEKRLHRRLYEAARWEGVDHETLAGLIASIDDRRTAPIRHAKGHDGHIHIRIDCGPDEPKCR